MAASSNIEEEVEYEFIPFLRVYKNGKVERLMDTDSIPPGINDIQTGVSSKDVSNRRPPEHPLPIAYQDSLAALHWVASHQNTNGPEPWLNNHADFDRLFLAGESSGANISHNLALTAGNVDLLPPGVDILGIALIHPYFWGSEAIGSELLELDKKESVDKLWGIVCPSSDPDNNIDHPCG